MSASNATPKLPWIEGKYNGASVRIAGGFITATVFWATVSRGEPTGYQWKCNGFESRKENLYRSMDQCKTACERFIARKLDQAGDEISALIVDRS